MFSATEAARFLDEAHRARARYQNLPEAIAPTNFNDAYAAQEALGALWEPRFGSVAGRKIAVAGVQADTSAAAAPPAEGAASADAKSAEKKSALRDQALADAGVQTMLEVFPAEIRDVEEM